jgi:hypothetical protein
MRVNDYQTLNYSYSPSLTLIHCQTLISIHSHSLTVIDLQTTNHSHQQSMTFIECQTPIHLHSPSLEVALLACIEGQASATWGGERKRAGVEMLTSTGRCEICGAIFYAPGSNPTPLRCKLHTGDQALEHSVKLSVLESTQCSENLKFHVIVRAPKARQVLTRQSVKKLTPWDQQ